MATVVKVSYEGIWRRFTLPAKNLNDGSVSGPLLDLQQFEAKVRDLFILPPGPLELTYQDTDGYTVTMASDKDVEDALVLQGLNPLYVTVRKNSFVTCVKRQPSQPRALDVDDNLVQALAIGCAGGGCGGDVDKALFELRTAISNLNSRLDALDVSVGKMTPLVRRMDAGLTLLVNKETDKWRDTSPSRGDSPNSDIYDSHCYDVFRSLTFTYGDNGNDCLSCMVTGLRLPWEDITAMHVVGKEVPARIIMNIGVDDERNAVLCCTPVKEAWLQNKICFSWSSNDNTYTCLVLDEELRDWRLRDFRSGSLSRRTRDILGELTFGELHGKNMEFKNNLRPYKRCMSLMSRLRRRWAAQEGCKPMFNDADGYDFDSWSEGSYKEKVLAWLQIEGGVGLKESEEVETQGAALDLEEPQQVPSG